MNMKEAARETAVLALNNWDMSRPHKQELDLTHILVMEEKIRTTEMSEAKMGRWLGWMQAAVVAGTNLTLDDMKQINMKWAD